MNLFVKVLAVATLAIATMGCDPIKGNLEVKKAFDVKSKKTTFTVPVGNFRAEMEMANRSQIKVTAKIGNKNKTMTFDLPNNSVVPENGTFDIPASQIGQEFSLQGDISTEVKDSPKYSGYEMCSYQTWETQCYVVNNQHVCQDKLVTRHGQQFVEYFNRTTNKHFQLHFVDTEHLATFHGMRSTVEKYYLGKGRCY